MIFKVLQNVFPQNLRSSNQFFPEGAISLKMCWFLFILVLGFLSRVIQEDKWKEQEKNMKHPPSRMRSFCPLWSCIMCVGVDNPKSTALICYIDKDIKYSFLF